MNNLIKEDSSLKAFLDRRIKDNPANRMKMRQDIRMVLRERFFEYESVLFENAPFNPDIAGNILGIEFKEGELEEGYSAELKLHPEDTYKYLAIINSLIDNVHHKRFSKFHECGHVVFDLFDEDFVAFRTPSTFRHYDPTEVICNVFASEMMFYYPELKADLVKFNNTTVLSEFIIGLAKKYHSSIEATARTFVENHPEKAFMVVVKEDCRKDERALINNNSIPEEQKPKLKPRVAYSVRNQHENIYLYPNKSFPKDSLVYRSYYNEETADDTLEISDLECGGHGKYRFCLMPEDGLCYCVGVEC